MEPTYALPKGGSRKDTEGKHRNVQRIPAPKVPLAHWRGDRGEVSDIKEVVMGANRLLLT